MSFVRSLGGALGVAASGTIMTTRLASAFASAGLDVRALTTHRMAQLHFTPVQQAAVGTAYRTALTGCFLLSGVVMTLAFVLVLGLPEITLRSEIDDA
jgi:hypothetical protein